MSDIRKLSTSNDDFQQQLDALLAWESVSDTGVNDTVNQIIQDIRQRGNEALLEFTHRFDRWQANSADDLQIPLSR
ncbi:MAG: histidinol dehydrogenase, partial [Candidatus Thiodiazotropha taylori]